MGLLLALDVGNTHIIAGVLSGSKILTRWRLGTDRSKTEDEYGLFLYELFTISTRSQRCCRSCNSIGAAADMYFGKLRAAILNARR